MLILPGKYGGRELERGGEFTLTYPLPARERGFFLVGLPLR